MHTISSLCKRVERVLNPTTLKFDTTTDALQHNAEVFKKHDFSLQSVLDDNKDTILTPGSEFQDLSAIEDLLVNHSDWQEIKSIISQGGDYHISHILDPLE